MKFNFRSLFRWRKQNQIPAFGDHLKSLNSSARYNTQQNQPNIDTLKNGLLAENRPENIDKLIEQKFNNLNESQLVDVFIEELQGSTIESGNHFLVLNSLLSSESIDGELKSKLESSVKDDLIGKLQGSTIESGNHFLVLNSLLSSKLISSEMKSELESKVKEFWRKFDTSLVNTESFDCNNFSEKSKVPYIDFKNYIIDRFLDNGQFSDKIVDYFNQNIQELPAYKVAGFLKENGTYEIVSKLSPAVMLKLRALEKDDYDKILVKFKVDENKDNFTEKLKKQLLSQLLKEPGQFDRAIKQFSIENSEYKYENENDYFINVLESIQEGVDVNTINKYLSTSDRYFDEKQMGRIDKILKAKIQNDVKEISDTDLLDALNYGKPKKFMNLYFAKLLNDKVPFEEYSSRIAGFLFDNLEKGNINQTKLGELLSQSYNTKLLELYLDKISYPEPLTQISFMEKHLNYLNLPGETGPIYRIITPMSEKYLAKKWGISKPEGDWNRFKQLKEAEKQLKEAEDKEEVDNIKKHQDNIKRLNFDSYKNFEKYDNQQTFIFAMFVSHVSHHTALNNKNAKEDLSEKSVIQKFKKIPKYYDLEGNKEIKEIKDEELSDIELKKSYKEFKRTKFKYDYQENKFEATLAKDKSLFNALREFQKEKKEYLLGGRSYAVNNSDAGKNQLVLVASEGTGKIYLNFERNSLKISVDRPCNEDIKSDFISLVNSYNQDKSAKMIIHSPYPYENDMQKAIIEKEIKNFEGLNIEAEGFSFQSSNPNIKTKESQKTLDQIPEDENKSSQISFDSILSENKKESGENKKEPKNTFERIKQDVAEKLEELQKNSQGNQESKGELKVQKVQRNMKMILKREKSFYVNKGETTLGKIKVKKERVSYKVKSDSQTDPSFIQVMLDSNPKGIKLTKEIKTKEQGELLLKIIEYAKDNKYKGTIECTNMYNKLDEGVSQKLGKALKEYQKTSANQGTPQVEEGEGGKVTPPMVSPPAGNVTGGNRHTLGGGPSQG
jgi:hypothetical protein